MMSFRFWQNNIEYCSHSEKVSISLSHSVCLSFRNVLVYGSAHAHGQNEAAQWYTQKYINSTWNWLSHCRALTRTRKAPRSTHSPSSHENERNKSDKTTTTLVFWQPCAVSLCFEPTPGFVYGISCVAVPVHGAGVLRSASSSSSFYGPMCVAIPVCLATNTSRYIYMVLCAQETHRGNAENPPRQ